MRNASQRGDIVTLTAPYAVASGGGVLVGSIFGVAASSVASGASVEAVLAGVCTLPALASDAFTVGAAVYWDDTNKRCTVSATGNSKIGVAVVASTAAFVRVRLNGVVTAGASLTPTLRVVSTNTNFPNNYSTTYKQMMTRRRHVISSRVTQVRARLVNAYVDPATWTEASPGAASTYTIALEKNGVNLGSLQLSGSSSIVVPDNSQVDTDLLTVDLYPGDVVYSRTYITNPNGIPYEGNTVSGTRPQYNDTANGEACYAAASGITDATTGTGALTGGTNVTSAMGGPFALIGLSNVAAVGILGDSIEVGIGEAMSASSARGVTHVSLAPLGLGVVKIAQGGDGAVKFVASNTRRRAAMAGILTNIVCNYVFNDVVNFSRSSAQVVADHTTIAGYFSGIPYDVRTVNPYSTSTDSYATTANQTPQAAGTSLNTANDALRALPSGVRKCWETSDAMGTGRNTNIWKADGVVGNRRTADGVHPTRIGADEVVTAGVFQASFFPNV